MIVTIDRPGMGNDYSGESERSALGKWVRLMRSQNRSDLCTKNVQISKSHRFSSDISCHNLQSMRMRLEYNLKIGKSRLTSFEGTWIRVFSTG